MELLARTVEMVAAEGWSIANIDCAVICERPKLAPRRAEMQDALGAVVRAPVSIKGNRAEGLGALGRAEGVACLASTLLVRPPDVAT
jgi:2-C-methyl-D-erythritol 2,4-cyclodiphosphate synthase